MQGSSNSTRRKGAHRRVLWREKVLLLNGTTPRPLMEKKILGSDLSKESAMLVLRQKEKKGDDAGGERKVAPLEKFMTEKEKTMLEIGVPLLLIDREGEEYPHTCIFSMNGAGEYEIAGEWLKFAEKNQLREGDMADVFVFRVPEPSSSSSGEKREWTLGMAVCSRVPADEMARRALRKS